MAKSDTAVPAAPDESPESLEQVRDILFGTQMRTVDRRLAQLEQRLRQEVDDLRKETGKQLKGQESWATKQVNSLDTKIKTERSKRTDELKALRRDLRDGLKNLGKDLAQLDDATSLADADMRDQVLRLTETLSANITALSDRVTADLGRTIEELRSEEAREMASVAEVFTDIAHRLGEERQIPTEG